MLAFLSGGTLALLMLLGLGGMGLSKGLDVWGAKKVSGINTDILRKQQENQMEALSLLSNKQIGRSNEMWRRLEKMQARSAQEQTKRMLMGWKQEKARHALQSRAAMRQTALQQAPSLLQALTAQSQTPMYGLVDYLRV